MKHQWIRDILLNDQGERPIQLRAWIRSKRVSKNIGFLVISDGSCQETLQVIVEANSPSYEQLESLQTGAAIAVQGLLRESPARGQKWEILVESLELIGKSDASDYPLQKKTHSLEFLREIGHLRPRTNTLGAVFRIRHVISQAIHEFLSQNGFYWAHTPILTASDCEGAGELFKVTTLPLDKVPQKDGKVDYAQDFFGKATHLTVSGQLEAEFLALSMGRVYTFGPTFRAENSNTARHLAEFWMVEPEVAFADLQDNMQLAEKFIQAIIQKVLIDCPSELEFLEKRYKVISREELEKLAKTPFTLMSYSEAIERLKKAKKPFEHPVKWGLDLQTEHERYLTEVLIKNPVTVFDYPKEIKPFYMRSNADGKTVAAMDLLVPGVGELIGGSQREERLEHLKTRIDEMGLASQDLDWYLDLRRYGTVPHSGFGLGLERMVMFITGMQNIRDVIPCPRAPGNIAF